MNKVFTTFALLVTLTTSAAADPLSDFFGGIFGGQSTQPQQTVKGKKGKHGHTVQNDTSDDHVSGGSRMVASFYGHGEIGRAHV